MKTFKQLEQLQEAHQIINDGKSGNPDEFSQKLYVSKRQLYVILDHLKEMGAPIKYDKLMKKYYYETSFDLMVNFTIQVLKEGEIRTIYGGNVKNFTKCKVAAVFTPYI